VPVDIVLAAAICAETGSANAPVTANANAPKMNLLIDYSS